MTTERAGNGQTEVLNLSVSANSQSGLQPLDLSELAGHADPAGEGGERPPHRRRKPEEPVRLRAQSAEHHHSSASEDTDTNKPTSTSLFSEKSSTTSASQAAPGAPPSAVDARCPSGVPVVSSSPLPADKANNNTEQKTSQSEHDTTAARQPNRSDSAEHITTVDHPGSANPPTTRPAESGSVTAAAYHAQSAAEARKRKRRATAEESSRERSRSVDPPQAPPARVRRASSPCDTRLPDLPWSRLVLRPPGLLPAGPILPLPPFPLPSLFPPLLPRPLLAQDVTDGPKRKEEGGAPEAYTSEQQLEEAPAPAATFAQPPPPPPGPPLPLPPRPVYQQLPQQQVLYPQMTYMPLQAPGLQPPMFTSQLQPHMIPATSLPLPTTMQPVTVQQAVLQQAAPLQTQLLPVEVPGTQPPVTQPPATQQPLHVAPTVQSLPPAVENSQTEASQQVPEPVEQAEAETPAAEQAPQYASRNSRFRKAIFQPKVVTLPDGAKKYVCPVCQNRYSSTSAYTRHQYKHDAQFNQAYRCTKCGMGFYRRDILSGHMKTCKARGTVDGAAGTPPGGAAANPVNSGPPGCNVHERNGRRYYSCSFCRRSFSSPTRCAQHMQSRSCAGFFCKSCNHNCGSAEGLQQHSEQCRVAVKEEAPQEQYQEYEAASLAPPGAPQGVPLPTAGVGQAAPQAVPVTLQPMEELAAMHQEASWQAPTASQILMEHYQQPVTVPTHYLQQLGYMPPAEVSAAQTPVSQALPPIEVVAGDRQMVDVKLEQPDGKTVSSSEEEDVDVEKMEADSSKVEGSEAAAAQSLLSLKRGADVEPDLRLKFEPPENVKFQAVENVKLETVETVKYELARKFEAEDCGMERPAVALEQRPL